MRTFFEVIYNIAMPIIWRNKTWQARSIEIKGDSQEWRNIGMDCCTPNPAFLDKPLVIEK